MIFYRTFLSCCIIILFFISGNAQESTYYYKQIRIVKDGQDISTPTGGQFISFYSSVCFESDIKGVTVGHGLLEKKSSGQYVEYKGRSYWGPNTIFKFNSTLERLNVITTDGVIYVYTRSIPPSNVFTCTLIKKKNNSNSNFESDVPIYTPPNQNNINDLPDKDTKLKVKEIRYKEKCHNCGGKGNTIYNTYPPTYGLSSTKVWCSECRKYYTSDIGHSHRLCGYCHGTGEVEKVRYENVYE